MMEYRESRSIPSNRETTTRIVSQSSSSTDPTSTMDTSGQHSPMECAEPSGLHPPHPALDHMISSRRGKQIFVP